MEKPGTTGINRDAPAVAECEAEVGADPVTVWDVITGIDRWADWNPDIKEASISGPLAEGSVIRWKAGPVSIISTIRSIDRPNTIAWSGEAMGIHAVHVWRLEARGSSTIVRSEESWEGPVVRILSGWMQKVLEKAVCGGLSHMKAESEQRAAARVPE